MNSFDLGSISEHDQLGEEMTRRGMVIARFYRAMVDSGLPADVAANITMDWARAALRAGEVAPCGCDCDICRGEG